MIKLADIFQSGMVLQCGKPVKIWGQSDRRQVVSVTVNDKPVREIVAGVGSFVVDLPAREASTGNRIAVHYAENQRDTTTPVGAHPTIDEIVLEDVAFGEVWIAGGQSNMEFPLRYDREYSVLRKTLRDDSMRFYEVAKIRFHEEDCGGLVERGVWNRWRQLSPESCRDFSAAAVYFALSLRKRLGVPVGIVSCNYGATSAATWTDPAMLKRDEDLAIYTDEYESVRTNLNHREYLEHERLFTAAAGRPLHRFLFHLLMIGVPYFVTRIVQLLRNRLPEAPVGFRFLNRPGGLYDTMQSAIRGFGVRGVIWYQGEADDERAEVYAKLFATTISCWRRDWNEELPFLFVQLAPFLRWLHKSGDLFPAIRAAQQEVADSVPHSWLASIMDAGDRDDLHPKRKRPVGERLARLALAKVYGFDVPADSPRLSDASLIDHRLIVRFLHCADGLRIDGRELDALEVRRNDGTPVRFKTVQAAGSELRISLDGPVDPGPLEISFAEKPYCLVNVFNSAGIPARPGHVSVDR